MTVRSSEMFTSPAIGFRWLSPASVTCAISVTPSGISKPTQPHTLAKLKDFAGPEVATARDAAGSKVPAVATWTVGSIVVITPSVEHLALASYGYTA